MARACVEFDGVALPVVEAECADGLEAAAERGRGERPEEARRRVLAAGEEDESGRHRRSAAGRAPKLGEACAAAPGRFDGSGPGRLLAVRPPVRDARDETGGSARSLPLPGPHYLPCLSASLPSPSSSSPVAPSPAATRPARRAPSATSTAPTPSPSSSSTPSAASLPGRRRRGAPGRADVVRHLLGQRDRPVRHQPRRHPLARDARRDGHARPPHVRRPAPATGGARGLLLPEPVHAGLRPGRAADASADIAATRGPQRRPDGVQPAGGRQRHAPDPPRRGS